MKNTKHTKMNDSSSDQEVTSQSKRKILTSIGVTSGVLGAGALSQHWVKPVVNSVVLPRSCRDHWCGGDYSASDHYCGIGTYDFGADRIG